MNATELRGMIVGTEQSWPRDAVNVRGRDTRKRVLMQHDRTTGTARKPTLEAN